ncbi:MAG: hypothetical protein IH613_04485 [Desulfuromonadales bacterium]|nr:hypothetical protein [Desulfuromonadales bacterium]
MDDFWQITAASRGYWFGSGYDWTMYVHLPVYSFWLGIVHITGLPLRIATELIYLISGFFFVISLRKVGISAVAAFFSYVLIVFHPASFESFNYVLPGTLYAPIFLLALASVLLLWANRDNAKQIRCSIIVGVSFALLWHIRKENILLVAILVIVFFFLCVDFWREKRPARQAIYKASLVVLIPVLIILSSSILVKTANLAKFGLFVATEMDSPGYKAAYKALLRIKPDKPIRFVPVPKDVRFKAYSVSPAFKELEPFFEGDFGVAAASETRKWMGIENEIAAGWFYWALKNAAVLADHHDSAVAADDYFQQIAVEINRALDNKELESRFVLFSFLDPETSNWLPYLPASIKKIRARFISTNEPPAERDSPGLHDSVRRAFDIAANRRIALLQGPPVIINGWVFAKNDDVTMVEIQTDTGIVLGSTYKFISRPDVASSYSGPAYGNVAERSGIKILLNALPEQLSNAHFVVHTGHGGLFDIPLVSIDKGRPYDIEDATARKIIYAFDEISIPDNPGNVQKAVKSFIWGSYGKLLVLLEWAGLLGIILLAVYPKRINLTTLFLYVLLGSSIVLRGGLFSLIDASSWPGDQPRYLFPAMQIYGVFLLMLIAGKANIVLDVKLLKYLKRNISSFRDVQ